MVNTKMPPNDLLQRYLKEGQEPVVPDVGSIARQNIAVYAEDLIGDQNSYVRHDPHKLTTLIMKIAKNETRP
ncbi:MAG TPA: hypothetical protein ENJ61_09040 [Aquifex aeolicus]|uniref:Uncharacterized protein n=1 Tax=Aquifex aeolicus TaxID=63363 RepID=A0A7C5L6Z8_AQUAO|nr:hypothetical protein [Aquifex aeolicus]